MRLRRRRAPFRRSLLTEQPLQDRIRNDVRGLQALRLLPREGQRTHPRSGRAGVDDVNPHLVRVSRLVRIGAKQSLQRRLGRSVCTPEGARLGPHRGSQRNDVSSFRLLEQRIEGRDQRLGRAH